MPRNCSHSRRMRSLEYSAAQRSRALAPSLRLMSPSVIISASAFAYSSGSGLATRPVSPFFTMSPAPGSRLCTTAGSENAAASRIARGKPSSTDGNAMNSAREYSPARSSVKPTKSTLSATPSLFASARHECAYPDSALPRSRTLHPGNSTATRANASMSSFWFLTLFTAAAGYRITLSALARPRSSPPFISV